MNTQNTQNAKVTKLAVLKSWGIKGYGLASIRRTDGVVESYFLHLANVIYCQPEEPCIGCVVKFEVGPPQRPGQNPVCLNACIFSPVEKLDAETAERILAIDAVQAVR
jgi:hypothetical protein